MNPKSHCFLFFVVITGITVSVEVLFGPLPSLLTFASLCLFICLLSFPIDTAKFVFFVLVLGLGIGRTAFAHIYIPLGIIPLYITEMVMIVTILAGLFRTFAYRERLLASDDILGKLILVFIIYGIIRLFFDIRTFGVEALRDSALFYYAIFYFLIQILISSEADIKKLFYIGLIVGIFIPVNLVYMVLQRQMPVLQHNIGVFGHTYGLRYMSGNPLFSVFVVIWMLSPLVSMIRRRILAYVLGITNLVAVVFTFYRSLFLAMFSGAILLLFFSPRKKIGTLFLSIIAACLIVVIGISIVVPTTEAMIFLPNRTSFDSSGRTWIWKAVLEKFLSRSIVTGIGFGESFFSSTSLPKYKILQEEQHQTGLHNSHLAVLIRMGILGGLIFLGILIIFYYNSFRFIRAKQNSKHSELVILFLSMHFSLAILAFFSLLLEQPYWGIFFWIIMGLNTIILRLNREEIRLLSYVP